MRSSTSIAKLAHPRRIPSVFVSFHRVLQSLRALSGTAAAIVALTAVVALTGPVLAHGTENGGPTPANLEVPTDAASFVWTFEAPEAELINRRGEVVARHFAGPTWQSTDGSAVIAKSLERADAPAPDSIPWLLLQAKDHTGSGMLSTVTYIQRLETSGGIAPIDGCDVTRAGAKARQPYTATYAFYYPVAPAA